MDGSRGYYAKWNKSERQMPYDLTYMWNLENKTNQQTKQHKNRLIETENKWVLPRGEWGGEMGEISGGD